MIKTYHCVIQTCSPIHIGCDEVYEPFGFRVDDHSLELVIFSPYDFIATLEKRSLAQFSEICMKGSISSMIEIYKFLSRTQMDGRRIQISPAFAKHYNEVLNLPLEKEKNIQQNLNRFVIDRTAYLPHDSRAYIPGSAIKGAMRTAYLNARAKRKKLKRYRAKEAKKLERALLDGGAFSTDPFRCIKISDFKPVGEVKTRIVYAVNEKKRPSKFKARGPYQILEIIEPGSRFIGTITIETPQPTAGIVAPITFASLVESIQMFYSGVKEKEEKELENSGIETVLRSQKDGERLIRLGRHSGAESVTIEGNRSIKIMTRRGEKPKWGKEATTFWLASEESKPKLKKGLKPFGWATLKLTSPQLLEELEKEEGLWQLENKKSEFIRLEKIAKEKKELLERARKQARIRAEEERKKREEEERKAYLESLSPEERDIEMIKDPNVSEQQVVEIYRKIDEFSEANRKRLAEALKDYWIRHNKWKGKLSHKQKQKVARIKEILEGE